jgi:GH25 family lysozyme M1 (1,4-beta-N-acetylmuramidase)
MSNYVYSGVDLSQHNGQVDFKKLKAGGYDFVILRAGYGRLTSQKDKMFDSYYKDAVAAGLEVGCYWFSYATTIEEAKLEAKAFLSVISGKKFSFPCYYDVEDTKTSLKSSTSKATATGMVNAWCKAVEDAGYKAGLYTFYSAINRFNISEIKYEKWLAKWSSSMGTCSSTDWAMWQYAVMGSSSESTKSGKVPGCENCSGVDMDYSYKDYPKIIGVSFSGKTTTTTTTTSNTSTSTTTSTLKSVETIAKEVIDGKWGNGDARKKALTEAGYNYTAVQTAVNKLVSSSSSTKTTTVIKTGSKLTLKNVNLYASATSASATKKLTGTYYVYSDSKTNNRIRITNSSSNVGKTPAGNYVTGWVKYSDII